MMQADLFVDVPRETFAADAAARSGMARALEHAEDVCPAWGDVAFAWLERYARRHERFQSEDVSDASIEYGLVQPPTLKAWGSIYVRAAKAGIIRKVGYVPSRYRHSSPTPEWASLVFGRAA